MPHEGQLGIIIKSKGHKLLGTLFLARGDEPKPTAVILHGIPGIEKNYDIALALRNHGWNSVIFHYRGCWGSEGAYNVHTIPNDVRAALNELGSGKYPQVNSDKVTLIGHSLGGWAAVLTASRDSRVNAVAVIGAVTIPGQLLLANPEFAAEFTPWLSNITPRELAQQWSSLDNAFIPIEQARKLAPRPLLIIHGQMDEEIPKIQAEMLYEHASEPRQLIIHPEANHSFTWHRPWLCEQIVDWVDNLK